MNIARAAKVRGFAIDWGGRIHSMRRLVRAYGFEHLPVLLTLDAEPRVMRVQQL